MCGCVCITYLRIPEHVDKPELTYTQWWDILLLVLRVTFLCILYELPHVVFHYYHKKGGLLYPGRIHGVMCHGGQCAAPWAARICTGTL